MPASGALASTLANDAAAFAGSVSITGTSAVTLADDDAALSGNVPYAAAVAATEEDDATEASGFFSQAEGILLPGVHTYLMTITGAGDSLDDVTIPISSLNITLSVSERDFMSVEIPGLAYLDDINDRPNGQILINGVITFPDGSAINPINLVTIEVDEMNIEESPDTAEIVLKGRLAAQYASANFVPIPHVFEKSSGTNGYTVKAAPNLAIRPYDIAVLPDDTAIAVGRVHFNIGTSTAEMTIEEIDPESPLQEQAEIAPVYGFFATMHSYNTK